MLENENRKDEETTEEIKNENAENAETNPENAASEPQERSEYAFKWNYTEDEARRKEEKKKSERKGMRIYAASITAAFVLCFGALAALLIADHYANDVKTVERTVYVREYDSESGVLTVPEIAEKAKTSTVSIEIVTSGGTGIGTGIIMTSDGYIATNYHVVENADKIKVVTSDGEEYDAEIVGSDSLSDLSVIKADASGLTTVDFGDSDSLVVGELAVAIGTPAGIELAGSVTTGVISGINRNIKIYSEKTGAVTKTMTLIQTSASISDGYSGGPLLNEYGQVIGIITPQYSGEYEGIGFAIPITSAKEILQTIIETGKDVNGNATDIASRRAIIGISGSAVSSMQGYSSSGVLVAEVKEGYDAENHLKPGDIIIGIDGNEVLQVSDISAVINKKNAGDRVTLKICRGGKVFDVTVELGYEQDE